MSFSNFFQYSDQTASSALAQKKRQACERCRSQKLKCIRNEGIPNQPCFRCTDARVDCITNTQRRIGRPAKPRGEHQQDSNRRTDAGNGSQYTSAEVPDDVSWNMDDFGFNSLISFPHGSTAVDYDSAPSLDTFHSETRQIPFQQAENYFGMVAEDRETGLVSSSSGNLESQLLRLQQQLTKLVNEMQTKHWSITASMALKYQMEDYDIIKDAQMDGPSFNPLAATFQSISIFVHLLDETVVTIFSQQSAAVSNRSGWVKSQYVLARLRSVLTEPGH
ncbi:hypothetical protein PFICI_06359 [Pestalotiopsis fici W106-1]|uniref:Zn(2)-C6 fungal-type domain-containing protein n=1 Tax=Pestalotiopsis fici (strain W106-1 / CGMCC3.15140) TaxID=1229662 RepID=W3X7J7_PESFW|nr:uncharacterized protein PFICI_06359 [Pestalotiopsis fici W106-1]ETS81357.1 hypothetical protein PFICI_06359 [Pestalotiopsis fici W106-1]